MRGRAFKLEELVHVKAGNIQQIQSVTGIEGTKVRCRVRNRWATSWRSLYIM